MMQPSIYYQCSCLQEKMKNIPIRNIEMTNLLTFRIENLYYCENCESVKCTRCTTQDIYLYYCPQCLFEVPGVSAHSEKSK